MPAFHDIADITTHWNGQKVQKDIERALGKGLKAAAIFLSNRIKEFLSIRAPRQLVQTSTGSVRFVAQSEAIGGHPPRILTGGLRRSITWEINQAGDVARVGTNMKYARIQELGGRISGLMTFPVIETGGVIPKIGSRKKYPVKWIKTSGVTIKPHPYLVPTLHRFIPELNRIIGQAATYG